MDETTQAADLITEIAALKARNAELESQLQWLIEQVKLSKKRQFGQSSEKSVYDNVEQRTIFNEAEFFADEKAEEPQIEIVKEHYRKARTRLTTDKLPPDLPVEVVDYELPENERDCPKCAEKMHKIGTETVREQLKIIPAKFVIMRHTRGVYGCRPCERGAVDEPVPIVKAPVPEPVIKGSFASPETIAHIMVQKFVMGLPLYRQESQFFRNGIKLSRQTMSNWLIKATEDWLEPIYDWLHRDLVERGVLHSDETLLQVLKEPGRSAQSKSYLWVYRTSGDTDRPIALSEYQQGRGSEHPKAFLAGFKGYLHTDGWEAYRKLPDVTIVGCLAHARRKYDAALKSLKPEEREGTNAQRGKRFCDKLFDVERQVADLPPDERYLRRLELARPILDEFRDWLASFANLGKNLFGEAVRYTINQWKYLNNYLLDGRLEISNNRIERTIKMFVICRKNFLFANTPRGAKASAVMFSILMTALDNGLNPFDYLVHIFRNAPNLDIRAFPENVERLLPWAMPVEIKARG